MASRNQYTYTPGYGMNNRPGQARNTTPRPAGAPGRPVGQPVRVTPQPQRPGAPRRQDAQVAVKRPAGDTAILTLLFIVAPITGVLGVFFDTFLWVFICVAVVALAAMWALRCFEPRGRAFVSGILIVLMAVALIAAFIDSSQGDQKGYFPTYGDPATGGNLSGGSTLPSANPTFPGMTSPTEAPAVDTPPAQQPSGVTAANSGVVAANSGMVAATAPPAEQPQTGTDPAAVDPAGVPAGSGQAGVNAASLGGAEAALANYMEMWIQQNYEGMVQYTTTDWQKLQGVPARQLSWNHAGWILNKYTITPGTYTPSADSATIKVTAELTQNTSSKKDMTKEFSAIVFNPGGAGTWLVDPDSMRSGVEVTAPTPAPDSAGGTDVVQPAADPTTAPGTKLWYNSDGGSFYHLEEKCSSINAKNYKFMKSFKFSELGDTKYSKLKACPTCKAPSK